MPTRSDDAFGESAIYFPTAIQQFQFYEKYSRFDHEKGRRETWIESVERCTAFLRELSAGKLPEEMFVRIFHHIAEMKAMPSMRLLATAGAAARRDNVSIYNCSYMPVENLGAFSEALLISMAGCGVGFSVETTYINRLPPIRKQVPNGHTGTYKVPDTSEGWAAALDIGIRTWCNGQDVDFDLSDIRPAGAILHTKGGRATGPGPLQDMLMFVKRRMLSRQGRSWRPIDAHDIMCKIGEVSVSGGFRRTAMISLFSPWDREMMHSKDAGFEEENSQRWNANNSAVLSGIPTRERFEEIFDAMLRGGGGEPGIFNRLAAIHMRPQGRGYASFGTNPCGEIILRPYSFCNLSSAVARFDDNLESLSEKIYTATVIGTIQSMATHFPNLRPEWRRNAEEERLLGVDINGYMDCPTLQHGWVLRELKDIAVMCNHYIAKVLDINPAAAVTCVKPSGNSSTLLNCSSGLHPRWSKFYVRNVRVFAHSPIFKVLQEAGVPMDPENGQNKDSATTWVIHFPVRSPEGAILRHEMSAIEQCENWRKCKMNWTEHNPSVTITYGKEEESELKEWVWENMNVIGGMTFLPRDNSTYKQMPYEEISESEYLSLCQAMPEIDFSRVQAYEHGDMTTSFKELACSAGVCEL